MAKNALIFGINGQDGYYLRWLLEAKGITVSGVGRQQNNDSGILNLQWITDLLADHKPDYIFHFAANSSTRHEVWMENHQTISTGTFNILEAVKTVSPLSKVFISGSGLQFKNSEKPILETDPFEARDAYSVSRIQSVYAARYYRSLGIKTYIGYFFNHESPRRTEKHISKMIAEAVKKINAGEDRIIEIGDPAVVKEWTYAPDIVEAVWTLIQQDEVFEAVIGSGKGYSIQQYIEYCFAFINRDWKKYVKIKDGFKAEYRTLVSDPSTITGLGWKPKTDIRELVKIMLAE